MISIIVAMDEKQGIGKKNDLLFRIPEDHKRFRQKTSGHPVIMGRKTFDSLHMPNGLPNRINIVLTKGNTYKVLKNNENKSVLPFQNLEAALGKARNIAQQKGLDEIFILGGGQIFKEVLDKGLVDRLYLTIVEGDYEADTFFPDYSDFKKVIFKKTGEWENYKYTFLDLEK